MGNNIDRIEASDLPEIRPNWGSRTRKSAEAEALKKDEIDREALAKAQILDEGDKSKPGSMMTLCDRESGDVFPMRREDYDRILTPEPV